MEIDKVKKLLSLRYAVLYARSLAYKREMDKALEWVDEATRLLQEMRSKATVKEFMFYQIMWIGLNNAKDCLFKRMRTISMAELLHVSEIPILFMWDEQGYKQEEYYWDVIKVEYERQSKRELAARFKRIWENIKQKYPTAE